MSALPRIGLIAGHGVDVAAWISKVRLPPTMNWRIIQNTNDVSPLDLEGLVWLWKPGIATELLPTERECLERWCRSIVVSRKNELIPIIVVSVDSLQSLDEESKEQSIRWLKSVHQMISRVYRRELKSWVPASMVDASRITMQVHSAESGQRLVDMLQRQRTSVALWHRQIRRQGEHCLAVGLVLVVLYFTLLLFTVPWMGSAKPKIRPTDPMAWARSDWQYHIKDCQQLLLAIQGRSLDKLSPAEQLRFNEHLRWLPISYDLLQQKRPTREVIRLRSQVEQLLQQMEGLVKEYCQTQPTNLTEQVAQKTIMGQLLDGVFEPRRPPTLLHDAAQRYWLSERAVTLLILSGMMEEPRTSPIAWPVILTFLKKRIEEAEDCRVHAPELKTAWLQELNAAQNWVEAALAKSPSITLDEVRQETTPNLLREAAGKSK